MKACCKFHRCNTDADCNDDDGFGCCELSLSAKQKPLMLRMQF